MAGREGMGGKEAWQTVSILVSLVCSQLCGGLLWAWERGEGRLSVGVYAGEGESNEFLWKYER